MQKEGRAPPLVIASNEDSCDELRRVMDHVKVTAVIWWCRPVHKACKDTFVLVPAQGRALVCLGFSSYPTPLRTFLRQSAYAPASHPYHKPTAGLRERTDRRHIDRWQTAQVSRRPASLPDMLLILAQTASLPDSQKRYGSRKGSTGSG